MSCVCNRNGVGQPRRLSYRAILQTGNRGRFNPRQTGNERETIVETITQSGELSAADVAAIVEDVVEGSVVRFADQAGPDLRNYRVNCDKIVDTLSAYRPVWTVRAGVAELAEAYARAGLTVEDVTGPRFLRMRHVEALIDAARLDPALRWVGPDAAPSPSLAGGSAGACSARAAVPQCAARQKRALRMKRAVAGWRGRRSGIIGLFFF